MLKEGIYLLMRYTVGYTILLLGILFVGMAVFLPQPALADDCAQITQTPTIYQATKSGSNVVLYFTPVNDQTTGYTINYGLSSGDDRYNVDFASGNSDGAITYTVGGLDPSVHYFFRVRAKNACSTGPYGSWVEATASGTTSALGGADASGSGTISPAPSTPPANTTTTTPTNKPTIKTPVTGVSSALVMGLVSLGLCGAGSALFISSHKKKSFF